MPERIVVIGCAGSGKSTLARTLAGRLCLRYVARDDLLGPGQESPEHRAAVDRATADQQWVFDGTPFAVEDLVYVRAGAIVFLDYSRTVVVWRSIRRAVRILITRRPEGPHQPASPLKWLDPTHPVRWSWTSQPGRRGRLRQILDSPALAHAERLHFTKPGEAAAWLRTVRGWGDSDGPGCCVQSGP